MEGVVDGKVPIGLFFLVGDTAATPAARSYSDPS